MRSPMLCPDTVCNSLEGGFVNKSNKLQIVLTIIAWAVSVLLAYGALKQDIAVVRSNQEQQLIFIRQQLEDIKSDVRELRDGQRSR